MRLSLLILTAVLPTAAFGQTESNTGTRITPPALREITPRGIARGTQAELTVEGFNLAGATRIHFSDPAVKGKILRVKELPDLPEVRLGSNGTRSTVDLGPLPPRNQVTVELEIDPEAPVGPIAFRLETPLGTSPEGTLLIEPYYGESPDKEPNDALEGAFEVFLPSILAGAISRPGDVDHFKLNVKAGATLSFDNGAMQVGSTLQPVVAILDHQGAVLQEYGQDGGRDSLQFAHRFDRAGVYYVRVSDYEKSGRASHTYRIKVGEFALVTSAFPLGVRKGAAADVELKGAHLGERKIKVTGAPSAEDPNALFVRPSGEDGVAFQRLRLAVNEEPEIMASGSNTSLANAQSINVPATINGRIGKPHTVHYFRIRSKKGQSLVLDVNARRLGSDLDSHIAVFDSAGKPIEQAVVRPVVETFTTLRDHDSAQPGIRITHWNNIFAGDYMMMGQEIVRVSALPRTPDEDIRFESFGGQRIAFFHTTPEAHAIDKAIYKVQIHPAGTQLPANGLPLTRLYAQNDDGGPGWGKDSYLRFTAPADGEYLVSIRDVQGLGGDSYPYRLTIREPKPSFQLAVSPSNPNVPVGGSIPLTLTAIRNDGFDGPIQVSLADLPPGFTSTSATILPGQNSTTLILSATSGAKLTGAVPLKAIGKAGAVVSEASPEDKLKLIALMSRADVEMRSTTKVIDLVPGGTASVTVKITRHNGFAGRVPVEVLNLPPRTLLPSFGLNGVLLNEGETERTFDIAATPQAQPGEQYIVVGGRVETRSTQQNLFVAPEPILVRIHANSQAASLR